MSLQSKVTSLVELRIKCTDLSDLDLLSKSDPMVTIFMRSKPDEDWVEVGRTEVVRNCLCPQFVTPIKLEYFFERPQYLRFLVVDVDDHDVEEIGYITCTISEIMCSRGLTRELTKSPSNKKNRAGAITITLEETKECRQKLDFQLKLSSLRYSSGLCFPLFIKPIVNFLRRTESGDLVLVHEQIKFSRKRKEHFCPLASVETVDICNGHVTRELLIRVYHKSNQSDNSLIGQCSTSVEELVTRNKTFNLMHPKRNQCTGVLEFTQFKVTEQKTFIDYILRGQQLQLSVWVDFTLSNDVPSEPTSLHYLPNLDPLTLSGNSYSRAIWSVGSILEPYDSDKRIPAFAFGCLESYRGEPRLFPLNLQDNPEVIGAKGLLDAYEKAIRTLQLSGPTMFAPIVRRVIAKARENPNDYHIALILTDGRIDDMTETKHAIKEAANLPISLVIVGVGMNDFSEMEELDGDDHPFAARDIVQFVSMRRFLGRANEGNEVAKEVLAEIPGQFMECMKYRSSFEPSAPPVGSSY